MSVVMEHDEIREGASGIDPDAHVRLYIGRGAVTSG